MRSAARRWTSWRWRGTAPCRPPGRCGPTSVCSVPSGLAVARPNGSVAPTSPCMKASLPGRRRTRPGPERPRSGPGRWRGWGCAGACPFNRRGAPELRPRARAPYCGRRGLLSRPPPGLRCAGAAPGKARTLGRAAGRPAAGRPGLPVHGGQRGPLAVQRVRRRGAGPGAAGRAQLAGVDRLRAGAGGARHDPAAGPGDHGRRRAAAVLVGVRGGPLLLRRRRADRVHARGPRDHPRRDVRGGGHVHAGGLGVRLHVHGVPGDRARQLHRRHRPGGPAQLDGAAVPELHHADEHGPERRGAGQVLRALAGDDPAAGRAWATWRWWSRAWSR